MEISQQHMEKQFKNQWVNILQTLQISHHITPKNRIVWSLKYWKFDRMDANTKKNMGFVRRYAVCL